MVYIDANTDLEQPAIGDLRELMAVGSTRDISVIALCARSPDSDEDSGYTAEKVGNLEDWSTCKLLRVEKGRLVELDDWGHVPMSDGTTLARFIETVRARFPAERYALVLDDHGMAWEGICGDETAEEAKDIMTLPALRDALRQGLGPDRLEVLGFDACLMANLEVAREVTPFARFMVASEENEPETGWSYSPLVKALATHPDIDGAALGRTVAESYQQSFTDADEGAGVTMSVVDLGRVAALDEAMQALAARCTSTVQLGRQGWMRISAARSKSEEYGASEDDDEANADLYDVLSFADAVARGIPAARPAAERVRTALRAAVVHAVRGGARPAAHGLTVFLPRQPDALEHAAPLSYDAVVGSAGRPWVDFLRAYTAATARQKGRPTLRNLRCVPRVVRTHASAALSASTSPGEIEQAWFVLGDRDGDQSMIIGQMPVTPNAKGLLEESWDGMWFKISDGRNTVICPLSEISPVADHEDAYTAQVPAEWKRARQKTWRDLTMHFYIREHADGTISGRLTYAFEETKYGPRQVTMRAGDRVRPLYSEIDPNGEESWVYSDAPEDQLQIRRNNGVRLIYEEVDRGPWRVGFLVRDYAENHAQIWTDVEVRD